VDGVVDLFENKRGLTLRAERVNVPLRTAASITVMDYRGTAT